MGLFTNRSRPSVATSVPEPGGMPTLRLGTPGSRSWGAEGPSLADF